MGFQSGRGKNLDLVVWPHVIVEKVPQKVCDKVPQRNCVTKTLPNFPRSFLLRFASKPLLRCVMSSNSSEHSLVLIMRLFWLCGSFLTPDIIGGLAPCDTL